MEKITQYLIQSTVHGSEVRAWEEDIMLPTYEIGKEEKNPIFLEKRVYQGSIKQAAHKAKVQTDIATPRIRFGKISEIMTHITVAKVMA